jgi:hypothetical protein
LAEARAKCHFHCIAKGRTDPRFQGKEFEMRDEIFDRAWVDHHERFSSDLDRAFASLRAGIGRFWQWDGTTHQLFALVASFLITALTFNTTAA